MSVCDHISETTLSSFTKFLYLSLSVSRPRLGLPVRRRCDTLCTSGFTDDVIFTHSQGTQPRTACIWHYGTLKLTHKGLAPYWGQSQISMIVLRKGSSFCLPIDFPPQTYLRITDWFILGVKLTRAMWILLVYNYSKAITTTLVLGITM